MNDLSRRGFFAVLGGGLAVLLLKPFQIFAGEPAKKKALAVPLSTVPELAKVGGGTIVKLKDTPVLLIRVDEQKVVAFNPTCTHDRCSVLYDGAQKQINCPCHKAVFDLQGSPLSGPPKTPLATYKCLLKEDKILVVL